MFARRGFISTVRFAGLATLACASKGEGPPARFGDLVITHASVLDVRNGVVLPNQRVRVENGTIISVAADDGSPALGALDAKGHLLTPGLIDAHLHLCNMLGPPSCVAPREKPRVLSMRPDSIVAYREVLAAQYLPYGVTSVRDVGSSERYLPLLLAWMQRSPHAPDFFPVGADLITHADDHIPAPWQVEVSDSADAARKVREYHDKGIRNIKLYWRLREPGFQGGLAEARRLGMNVTGHVDFAVVKVSRALDLGLTNFEHLLGWIPEVLAPARVDSVFQVVGARLRTAPDVAPGFYYLAVPLEWSLIGERNPTLLALIDRLKATDASVTPTLHIFAQGLGLSWFESPPRSWQEDTHGWSPRDRAEAVAGYRIMASYVKLLYDAGVRLNVGTDTPEPGKSVLAEMLLFHDAGIPMIGVFRAATLDTARGIGEEARLGSIEPGKHANFVLFDGDPLATPGDLLGGKTVIKDGVVVAIPKS
jgi:hypothetical protein